jgi:hypothetical protein
MQNAKVKMQNAKRKDSSPACSGIRNDKKGMAGFDNPGLNVGTE